MNKIFVIIIRKYQMFISPLFGAKCRFIPTCSNYAIEAIEKYGVIYGMYLSVGRILRCNPFGPVGYDPVPEKTGKP